MKREFSFLMLPYQASPLAYKTTKRDGLLQIFNKLFPQSEIPFIKIILPFHFLLL